MNEHSSNIDKLFRSGIDGYREAPSPEVWDNIDAYLDKNNIISIKKKYNQLKKVSLLLLFLLIGSGIYTWKHQQNGNMVGSNNNSSIKDKRNSTAQAGSTEKENSIPGHKENLSGNYTQEPVVLRKTENEQILKKATCILKDKKTAFFNTPSDHVDNIKNRNHSSLTKPGKLKITTTTGTYREIKGIKKLNNAYFKTQNTTFAINSEKEPVAILKAVPEVSPEKLTVTAVVSEHPLLLNKFHLSDSILITGIKNKKITHLKTPAFAATFFFSPNIVFNHLEDDRKEGQNDDKGEIKNAEQDQTSATFGVLVDYRLSSHWSLQSGLTFTNKVIRIEPKTIYANADANGNIKYRYNFSSGYLYVSPKLVALPNVGDSLQAFESINTLQYLGVPFAVKYNYPFRKFNFHSTVGASVNILTMGKIETEIADGPDRETNISNRIIGLKPIYLSGIAGVWADYTLTKRIAVSFMPSFNFAITSITKNSSVKSYPNSFSLAAGIRIKL